MNESVLEPLLRAEAEKIAAAIRERTNGQVEATVVVEDGTVSVRMNRAAGDREYGRTDATGSPFVFDSLRDAGAVLG